jgi:hypothetical protein
VFCCKLLKTEGQKSIRLAAHCAGSDDDEGRDGDDVLIDIGGKRIAHTCEGTNAEILSVFKVDEIGAFRN